MEDREESAIAFLRECATTFELFDKIRGCHGYLAPDCAAGLLGYLHGFGQGARIAHEEFGRDMQRHAELFLGIAGEPWAVLVEQMAKRRSSEVPMMYAVADFGRHTSYRNARSCVLSEDSRTFWSEEQAKVLGSGGMPAPHRIVLAEGPYGLWHLFFFDTNDVRFNEIAMHVEGSLSRWAGNAFKLGMDAWKNEDPGLFNRPPADLRI